MGKRIECVRFFSTEVTHSIWRAVSLISPVADCIVIRSVSFEEAASMFPFFLFTIIFIAGFASCETSLKVPRVVVSGFPPICGRFAHAFFPRLAKTAGSATSLRVPTWKDACVGGTCRAIPRAAAILAARTFACETDDLLFPQ